MKESKIIPNTAWLCVRQSLTMLKIILRSVVSSKASSCELSYLSSVVLAVNYRLVDLRPKLRTKRPWKLIIGHPKVANPALLCVLLHIWQLLGETSIVYEALGKLCNEKALELGDPSGKFTQLCLLGPLWVYTCIFFITNTYRFSQF